MSKIKDLPFGQYFQCEDIIARLLGDTVVFLNSKLILHNQLSCCDACDNWKDEDVTPINLQAVILLLVKECLIINDNQEENPDKVPPTSLKPGQYFLDKRGVVGLVFDNERSCYINDQPLYCWDYTKSIDPVTPLTIHQATLSLIQTFVENEHNSIPKIPPITFNKNSWYIKYKEFEFQEVYEQYYLQHAGKYWK